MTTLTIDTDMARELGINARTNGAGLGSNPFDPENEVERYEAWLDGWSEEDEESRSYESLFKS